MGLLDKIKNDLRKSDTVLITPKSVELEHEQLPILNATNDDEIVPLKEDVNEALFPFKNRNELKEKATELKNFFLSVSIPEKKTVFGKATRISNPKKFIQSTLQLMVTYWHDQLYIRDRICDLMFLKECIERKRMK
jgi:hypothetical protein